MTLSCDLAVSHSKDGLNSKNDFETGHLGVSTRPGSWLARQALYITVECAFVSDGLDWPARRLRQGGNPAQR